MIKRIRNLRISLAAKCQILFGAAVILIIGAALYVPWKRMDGLIQEVNQQTAEGLGNQAKLEHIVRERQKREAPGQRDETLIPATQESLPPGFVWPRLIPINPPRTLPLGQFELDALWSFSQHPNLFHFEKTYRVKERDGKELDRYRLAMPLYSSDEVA